jgi:hypothetical protein
VENKVVRMTYVKTEDQLVDILTNPLPRERFEKLRGMLGIMHLEGEVLENVQVDDSEHTERS